MPKQKPNTTYYESKLTLTIEEASKYSGVGQTKIRKLASEYNCPFALHIGSKTLIKREPFKEFILNTTTI